MKSSDQSKKIIKSRTKNYYFFLIKNKIIITTKNLFNRRMFFYERSKAWRIYESSANLLQGPTL
jgi:hypothetical protein